MTLRDALPTRSLIPACDVDIDRFEHIVKVTQDLEAVGGYKIGASLCLSVGLPTVVSAARRHTDKPLIYDHQKAGTDIPDTASAFMKTLANVGVNAVILFPFTGPKTQQAWCNAATENGLGLIVGGHMTHEHFLSSDNGYLPLDSVDRIYRLAAESGVQDFVVPGNNPDAILRIKDLIAIEVPEPVFYAPGFIAQRGEISEAGRVAGDRWHAIIGRAIYDARDVRSATEHLAHNL